MRHTSLAVMMLRKRRDCHLGETLSCPYSDKTVPANGCALSCCATDVCIPNRPVELEITKDGGNAEFICAPGGTLHPENLAEVFTKAGGTAKVQLTSLVPGAALGNESSSGKYTLTVRTLPSEARELFYTCEYGSPPTKKVSEVKITVAAAPQQSSTTTASTTSGGSAPVAPPRFATVGGLALGLASFAALQ